MHFAELYKIDLMKSYFVFRAKKTLQYKSIKWRRRLPEDVLTDSEIVFSEDASYKKYPKKLRLVRFYDAEQNRTFVFLTNDFHLTSLGIANLHKNRWQIELFHKWLQQYLMIKKVWGTTENAIRIQISAVIIIADYLVAIMQHGMQLSPSIYEVLQILSISLSDKTPLRELFEKTNSNDVKELNGPHIPGSFD